MSMRVAIAAVLASVLGLTAVTASAQLYRWTDEKGRVHITDTPPPASARNVQKKSAAGNASVSAQTPYEQTIAELKQASGGNDVPTLIVGRSVHRGFEHDAFDALLDSARYPKPGAVAARAQAAPAPPGGYVAPGGRNAPPVSEPDEREPEAPAAPGPYAPKAPPPAQR